MDDLASAMEWSARILHAALAEQELPGAQLHLIDAESRVTVVLLPGGMPQALHTARALIVVHNPVYAVLAAEAWGATVDARDPLTKDWVERRKAGEDVPVRALPPDYRFDLLVIDGESAQGECARRYWRIDGAVPQRTFTALEQDTLASPVTYPLFMARHAREAGVDHEELRRSAEHYLAHNHGLITVFEREEQD